MSDDARSLRSPDTHRGPTEAQVAIWQSLSTVEKAALIDGAYRAVRTLAMAGLRDRHPGLPDGSLTARFALLTLDAAVARRAYPELDDTGPAST